jgi:glycosyltransferase involved in cell wall biosynthesis
VRGILGRSVWVARVVGSVIYEAASVVKKIGGRDARLGDRPTTIHRSLADSVDVSLIICTRDRCRQLARCLGSVRLIRCEQPWELIVVDNGSVDETAAVVQEFIATASIPVAYVFEPKPGLGNAHNAGIGVASGEILAFTDDDCYPAPDFLSRVWSAFEDPSVGYVTGAIMLHDPTDHPMTITESTTPLTFPGRSLLGAGDVQGANMAFRRRVLLDIGGFDPLFGPGSLFNAEDDDVAGRASAMGWKGQYRPEVIVRHHHGRKSSDAPRLLKSYGIGIGAYHMKLLLSGHEFLWFARIVCQVPRRYKASRRMLLWEPVGAARYGCIYLTQALRTWFGTLLR